MTVDWGTSSLRIWLLDADGAVLAVHRGSDGMFGLNPDEFPQVLERHLADMGVARDVPVIICGMAGAATGWKEVPYVDVPTRLTSIADAAIMTETSLRRVHILPGLAQRNADDPDVMRGEETILLGAVVEAAVDGLVCLPGTHSKWAEVREGRLIGFQTSMTGETFALLSKTSTLSQFASVSCDDLHCSDAFEQAVAEALEAPQKILHALFSIRATPLLLGQERAADMPARLSGLLIGLEIAGMNVPRNETVTLISSGTISATYMRALEIAEIPVRLLNAEEMVRVGLLTCASRLVLRSRV